MVKTPVDRSSMRIQPRGQLLAVWQAVVAASLGADGTWVWGGRDGSDSVSDAQQLLCLMLPATDLVQFQLDQPDQTDDEVLAALHGLGDAVEVPRRLARICLDYLVRHTRDGTPSFAGGWTPADAVEPTDAQRNLDVVESYALSVTLTLAILGFARVLRRSVLRADLLAELDELAGRAGQRLTAAMIGLLRSFSVNVFDVESDEGEQLLRTVNQSGMTRRRLVEGLQRALRANAASLREIFIGSGRVEELTDTMLYELGWTWGLVLHAPEVVVDGFDAAQPEGHAESAPYLYFTAVALDGIAGLFSERSRVLQLLDEEQQRLARALQLRWDLTQQYWATLATFGSGRWPAEDIPWRTTDGQESEYFSLQVTSVAVRAFGRQRAADGDLARVGRLLGELAVRGRVIRRPLDDDPATGIHHPGLGLTLNGAEALGPPLRWYAADFAPLLLKRTLQVAGLMYDIDARDEVLALADDVWQHLVERQIGTGPGRGLWDQPGRFFPGTSVFDQPSWHNTFRVVEGLIAMTRLVESAPLASEPLAAYARHLLAEAEHLYAQELLTGLSGASRVEEVVRSIGRRLTVARGLVDERPAQAAAVALDVLRELSDFSIARLDL